MADEGGAERVLPSGVVTFLLSDVEGSTRLWEGDEVEMGAAIARHYELMDAAIVLHGGVRPTEQGEGDSVVGAFARPSDAVAAALAAQRAFVEEPWAPGGTLRIRIALHTGEVQLRDADYYVGRTVIRCARLRGIAHGGQTVLSAATRDLVGDRLPDGVVLRDLGSHRLKDLGASERVWQLCHADLPDEFPPLRSLDAVANNLPAQLTSFLGREAELADLRQVLGSARLVTLTGAGGAGKTRLAVHAVAEVAERYPDGAWWVELAPLTEPDLLPFAVARCLGLRVEGNRPVLDVLCEHLAGRDVLLALDNCEHLVEAAAVMVARFLAAAPALRIVATSREPLAVPGELVWGVPALDEGTAGRLFVERAGQVRPGFVPDAAEAEAIAGICRRLDRIPLAIELAAARVRMMSPDRIAAALDDRFRLLTGGGRTALPRQQTLETSVAWSHDLLGDHERTLLRRLSVFAGGFTLEAAEVVCADAPLDRYAVLELLSRLVNKSLVHVEHQTGASYRLLETIRLYAAQRLIEAGEADVSRGRHLAFFLDLAEQAEPAAVGATGVDLETRQDAALDRLTVNMDNLQAAYVWGLAAGRAESSLRLAAALLPLWRIRGRRVEGLTWLEDALAAGEEADPRHRLRALIACNRIQVRSGGGRSADRVDEAVRLAREAGDLPLLARALVGGGAYLFRGPHRHRSLLLEAAALAEELGDDDIRVDSREWLAVAAVFAGEPVEAGRLAEEAADLGRAHGNRYATRTMMAIRGMTLLMCGAARPALPMLEATAAETARAGERTVAAYSQAFAAWAWALLGAPDAAADACADAEGSASGLGDTYEALVRFGSGMATLVSGRPADAQLAFVRGRQLVGEIPGFSDLFIGPHAEAALALGEVDKARGIADEGIARSTDPPLRWQAGWARQARARVALADRQAGRAEDLAQQALAMRLAIGDAAGLADTLEFLAVLAAGQDSPAEAVRLLAAADAARRRAGCRRLAIHGTEAALAEQTRATLGEATFAEAWAQGAGLSAAEAVAYVARGRGERRRPATGWAALTPAESEVARLVADGLRNKEIAERLFVSPRTVQSHLAGAFAKLGLTSRVQLAQEFVRNTPNDRAHPGGTRRLSQPPEG